MKVACTEYLMVLGKIDTDEGLDKFKRHMRDGMERGFYPWKKPSVGVNPSGYIVSVLQMMRKVTVTESSDTEEVSR